MSACLLGVRCRYDGTSRNNPRLLARLSGLSIVPVCPEELGGLPTPRSPCRVTGKPCPSAPAREGATGPPECTGADVLAGRALVLDADGNDRTANFLRGAEEALRIAREAGARRACLKARSPSCDAETGVTAARLREAGIEIESVD